MRQVAELINLSYRQTKRLWNGYKNQGVKALISKKRGAKSNRALCDSLKQKIVSMIVDKYFNCKPGFITEKLRDNEGVKVSDETVRQLMIEHNLWIPNRKTKVHKRRNRKECEGELVQIDASQHRWFEDRGPKCHLHLIVDDATSKLKGGFFAEEETTEGYYNAFQPYLESEGRPLNVYCDKRGVFKVNTGENKNFTQFQKAMSILDIGIIYAHSPQAKGRVERAFGTLQDRLLCELRLRRISTIQEANEYLPKFIAEYNAKYGKIPANPFNAHRELKQKQNLKYILCYRHERRVTKNLEISYKGNIYQIDEKHHDLKRNKIEVIETLDKELFFTHNGVKLKTVIFIDRPRENEKYTKIFKRTENCFNKF